MTATVTRTSTWSIDPVHSVVEFAVKHMMIATVRGRFERFTGTVELDEADPSRSTVEVQIEAASINTRNEQRDGHLRSADFFAVDEYPTLEFRSTRLDPTGGDWKLEGELTVRGVTHPVVLDVEHEGVATDPWGNERIAFTARTEVDRERWGLTWNQALDTGGFVLSDRIELELDVSAIKVDGDSQ